MIVDVHLTSINLKDMGSTYKVRIFSSALSWYNQRIRTDHGVVFDLGVRTSQRLSRIKHQAPHNDRGSYEPK